PTAIVSAATNVMRGDFKRPRNPPRKSWRNEVIALFYRVFGIYPRPASLFPGTSTGTDARLQGRADCRPAACLQHAGLSNMRPANRCRMKLEVRNDAVTDEVVRSRCRCAVVCGVFADGCRHYGRDQNQACRR